ncbi:MAG: N-acetylmuramoyl-L-alanine amidase [Oscillospiraceae bacterium]|nr:N-acetylmuramoyl-L-alanine amidase [Oscillospiraceae bacterium]
MKQPKLLCALLSSIVLLAGSALPTAAADPDAADTQTTVAAVEDPAELAQAAAIPNIVITLDEAPKDEPDGLQTDEEGHTFYLSEGVRQVGMFTVTPGYCMGDLQGDGRTDANDAALLLLVAAKAGAGGAPAQEQLCNYSEEIENAYEGLQYADIDRSGAINANDAACLLQYAAKAGAGTANGPLGSAAYYADENGELLTGWVNAGDGRTYYATADHALSTGWVQIDGKRYYFGTDCVLHAPGYDTIGRSTYFFEEDGSVRRDSWIETDNGLRYCGANGAIASSGWLRTGGETYYISEETGRVSGLTEIGGKTYYFDTEGRMQTGLVMVEDTLLFFDKNGVNMPQGWFTEDGRSRYIDENGIATGFSRIDGDLYLFSEEGDLLSGWQTVAGNTYYCGTDGIVRTGMKTIDGETYLFNAAGVRQVGWVTDTAGTRFYNRTTGAMTKGWIQMDHGKLYFNPSTGLMVTGLWKIDGKTYSFTSGGVLQYGWITNSVGTRFFSREDGAMYTGLVQMDHGTLYFDPDTGLMQTGFQKLDGKTYYFDSNGVRQTGWLKNAEGTRFFSREDASMFTGLVKMDHGTLYFDPETGLMQTGVRKIGTQTYYFDSTGVRRTGWVRTGDGTRYFSPSTCNMVTGWQTLDGQRYYFDTATGLMATGVTAIGGSNYRFKQSGVYSPIRICLDAGHYGKYNRSTVVASYYESDFTWKFHLLLKAELEKRGVEVLTTRPNQETDRGLEDRGRASQGYDLFLSIHSNACGNAYTDAPLACCAINGSTDVLGQRLADTIAQVMETRQGGEIWKRVGDNGDYYGVIRGAAAVGTPGILLEHSYHTNLRSTLWLMDDANLQRMAVAEADVLCDYFDNK